MRVLIHGPVGVLVGELEEPSTAPSGVAIVCHPHPLHGGSLRNALVVRTARALCGSGLVTLRFNFRGVEGSGGEHHGVDEIDDAAAATKYLSRAYPDLALWAAGYSFGSRIVAELALRDPGVERLILIAFPCALYDPGFMRDLKSPGLILLGGADPYGNKVDFDRSLAVLPASLQLEEIPEADHFFRGRTPLVEEAVLRYARSARTR